MSPADLPATIFVTTKLPGFHSWNGATGKSEYLGSLHRHLFGCRLELSVVHDDREVEFHDVLEWLQAALLSSLVINASCEQHARRIALRASERWERAATVTVDEDGECGATVTASVDLG